MAEEAEILNWSELDENWPSARLVANRCAKGTCEQASDEDCVGRSDVTYQPSWWRTSAAATTGDILYAPVNFASPSGWRTRRIEHTCWPAHRTTLRQGGGRSHGTDNGWTSHWTRQSTRLQGIEQGETQAKQAAVLKLLRFRFESVPESVTNQITHIQSLSRLDLLFENVLTAQTLDEIDLQNRDS